MLLAARVAVGSIALAPFVVNATDIPPRAGDLAGFCQSEVKYCGDFVTGLTLSTSMGPDRDKYCWPAVGADKQRLSERVVQWIAAHPEVHDKSPGEAVRAAGQALYPCKPRAK